MSSYVVQGAKLECNFGDCESALQVTNNNHVYIEANPKATINDFLPATNIQSFGKCSSRANPAVAAATAANKGRLTPQPCTPNIQTPWQGGKRDVLINDTPVLLDSATLYCIWCGKIRIKDCGQ